MKKVFLVSFFIVLAVFVEAQSYHKLIRENVYWDEATFLGSAICSYDNIKRVEFSTDTTIGSHSYKKMIEYNFYNLEPGPFCPPFAIDTVANNSSVFMREDSINQKVYIYNSSIAPAEHLLFDFSLQPGDTFNSTYGVTTNLLVVDIDSIQIFSGEYRKRIALIKTIYVYDTVYMYESVGSSQGLYNGLLPAIGAWNSTLCVKENNLAVWGSECNYFFTNLRGEKELELEISPNPVADYIHFQLPDGNNDISIFNSHGQLVYSTRESSSESSFDVSFLPPGIYFIEARGENILRGKFVKE
jgi:hypothetical protein